MVQSNKILTVSYGTFSCTLEGFDDAFGTMKAIAEYFRDLAAEDRYFGAEPPQPDTDMLAHIAQKEISRRVEAHREDGGIVLRAQDASEAAAVAAPVAAAVAEPQLDEAVEADRVVDDQPVADMDAAPDVPDMMVENASEQAADDEVATEAEPEVDLSAIAEQAQDDTPEDQDTAFDAAPVAEAPVEEAAAAFFAAGQDDAEPEVEEVAEPAPAPHTLAADSIAAKLQRIRAVVSKGNAAGAAQDFSEDEHADPIDTPAETVDAKEKIAEMLGDAVDEADTPASDDEDVFLDDLNERLDALDPAEGIRMDTPAPADDSFEEDLEDAAARVADVMPEAAEPVIEQTVEEPVAEETADEVDAPAPAVPQARVVKVSKQEFDAILASDRGEDLPTVDLSEEPEAEDGAESSLSPEDEEDLLRELAAVEAEAADVDIADEVEDAEAFADEDEIEEDDYDSIFAEADAQSEADEIDADELEEDRAILSEDVDSDANVARLLDEAGDKLNDSDTSDRRSEFAHLRAAVAAGQAEEAAGGSMSEAASDGAYREDLARVVKPRRPDAGEARERSRRPEDAKPAPLKLVAAQRIDAEAAPVQPRRVMSTQVEEVAEDGADGKMKFADYADGVGAHELPDLLEAAAAYLSFVEGQEQFSRPQLMTKVRMVEQHEFSREDGLRSFGLLLRDGKIEKTQAGRFSVSDRIGFRPEDMRAAG